ncbi:MAG TPA: hypothetical protein VF180_07185 [Acidimicrobiia bacterium]
MLVEIADRGLPASMAIASARPTALYGDGGIEANGVAAHAAKEDVQRNAEKANDLIEWWVLYFTDDDVHNRSAELALRVEDAIKRRQSTPPAQPAA